jgi:Flp pilus assembly protein TadG
MLKPSTTKRACVRRLFWRDERGTQFVELAIVLPVMILLFAGVAEFGRYFYTYSTLAKAARAGARYQTTRPLNTTAIAQAQSLAVYGDQLAGCSGTPVLSGLQCSNIDVQLSTVNGVQVVTARVVNYQFQPVLDLGRVTGIAGASLRINVSPSVTMKYVY